MRGVDGFTLLEIVIGMLVLLALAVAVVPVSSQSLIMQDVLWQEKLSLKVIETKLEEACQEASTLTGFTALGPLTNQTNGLPQALQNASWDRDVKCLDGTRTEVACPTNLRRIRVTVNWTARGRQRNRSSSDYLISRIGVCGTGV